MQILASPSHAGDRAELDMQLIQLNVDLITYSHS